MLTLKKHLNQVDLNFLTSRHSSCFLLIISQIMIKLPSILLVNFLKVIHENNPQITDLQLKWRREYLYLQQLTAQTESDCDNQTRPDLSGRILTCWTHLRSTYRHFPASCVEETLGEKKLLVSSSSVLVSVCFWSEDTVPPSELQGPSVRSHQSDVRTSRFQRNHTSDDVVLLSVH